MDTTNPKRNKRPLIFLIVGVCNTLFDFGFYTLLTQTILQDSDQIAIAGLASGTVALICAFLSQNFITWHERPASKGTVVKFITFTGFGLWFLRPLLLALFIQMGPLYTAVADLSSMIRLPLSLDFVSKSGAFGFAALIILVYNYCVYDKIVFRERS